MTIKKIITSPQPTVRINGERMRIRRPSPSTLFIITFISLIQSASSWSWHSYRSIVGPSSSSSSSSYNNLPISYPGGYQPDGRHCVDICADVDPVGPICFNTSNTHDSCRRTGQEPGDWDYALLDQIFIPQFCRDLDKGVDDTVSHQNINLYPKGTHCLMDRSPPLLTIHGLWPNYWEGYPSCCRQQPGDVNLQLDPLAFEQAYPGLLARIDREWRDPTTGTSSEALCQILNHEWQKHGYCLGYRLDDQDTNDSARLYFSFTLRIAEMIGSATSAINLWALSGVNPSVEEIQALYPRQVNLFCAAPGDQEEFNHLLAVRSCWGRPESNDWQDDGLEMWDCHLESQSFGNQVPCNATKLVSLAPYVSPGGIDGMHGFGVTSQS